MMQKTLPILWIIGLLWCASSTQLIATELEESVMQESKDTQLPNILTNQQCTTFSYLITTNSAKLKHIKATALVEKLNTCNRRCPQNTTLKQRYTGSPFSIEWNDKELSQALKIIESFAQNDTSSGIHAFIIDAPMDSRISISFENTPWDQALDILLKQRQLIAQRFGNVLLIIPGQDCFLVSPSIADEHEIPEFCPPCSKKFTCSFDPLADKIIYQDINKNIPQIEAFIERFDQPIVNQ